MPVGVQGVYYGELLWVLAGTGALHTATVTGANGVLGVGIGNNVIVNNKGTVGDHGEPRASGGGDLGVVVRADRAIADIEGDHRSPARR